MLDLLFRKKMMEKAEVFTIKIGGQAGQGIKSAGLILAKLATRSGYFVYNHTEYPSLIRGGHNTIQVGISGQKTTGPYSQIDLLIALNQETVDKHFPEIKPGGSLFYDGELEINLPKTDNIQTYNLPIIKIAKESGGEIYQNTVGWGMVVAFLQADLKILQEVLAEQFAGKEPSVIEANNKAAEAGYNYFKTTFPDKVIEKGNPDPSVKKMIINGNDAIALGAIAAGLQFSAIYPMSPISSIIQTLAENQEKYGYIYKQPEDEISAINMCIGASLAGARTITATSGGGFCLMAEGLGLAGITETPVVVVLGMRPGPATGLPTWSSQGDLYFALHAAQDEFPRIVLAPGSVKEAYEMTGLALNLAEKYQTPVIILVDKTICENEESVAIFDNSNYQVDQGKIVTQIQNDYRRYLNNEDGISSRTFLGSGNYFLANSDEHDEYGYSSEKIVDRNLQMQKRMRKLTTCAKVDMGDPILFGPENAGITIVSWGSNTGSILEAMKNFDNVNLLQITWMNPFPAEKVKEILGKAKHIIDIECNFSGQLASLIKEKTGTAIEDKLLKYDGRPFFVEEIVEKLKGIK